MDRMRSSALFLTALLLSAFCLAQSSATSGSAPATGKIGPSAVWQPPADFVTKAHVACDAANPPNYGQCFLDQVAKSGASPDAVTFTRTLYKQSDGQVGIMIAFQKAGPVDMARVMYPLRANDNYGLLLVNGDPNVLDVDDLKKLDRAAMEQHEFYQAIKKNFPQADVWPGDRSGDNWPVVKPLPDGGQRFVVSYPILNGCHACRPVGLALFGWDFDAQGKFLRTTYIPVQPPPRKLRPGQASPEQPPPPAPTPSQTPPAKPKQ